MSQKSIRDSRYDNLVALYLTECCSPTKNPTETLISHVFWDFMNWAESPDIAPKMGTWWTLNRHRTVRHLSNSLRRLQEEHDRSYIADSTNTNRKYVYLEIKEGR